MPTHMKFHVIEKKIEKPGPKPVDWDRKFYITETGEPDPPELLAGQAKAAQERAAREKAERAEKAKADKAAAEKAAAEKAEMEKAAAQKE